MIAANPIPAKKYYDGNAKIIAIFEKLDGVINSIDRQHPKGKTLIDPKELFPMADEFIRVASDATSNLHEAYVNYIEEGGSGAAGQVIERETWRILKEIKNVVSRANRLSINPGSNQLREVAVDEFPDDAALPQPRFGAQPGHRHDGFHAQKTPQTAIFKQARRLGPEYGSEFLLAIDDTFVALKEMLDSVNAAGIELTSNHFPSLEASPETWVEPAISPDNIDNGITQLAQLLQRRRQAAETHWATKRTR